MEVRGLHLINGLIAYIRIKCEEKGKFIAYDKNNTKLYAEGCAVSDSTWSAHKYVFVDSLFLSLSFRLRPL